MNVLFTCAGRRNYLLEYFRAALGDKGRVLAADASDSAPALQEADEAFLVPGVHDTGYTDAIKEICAANGVGLLVPLNDLELPVLSRNRASFASSGVCVLVPEPDVVETCFDKIETARFLRLIGLITPLCYDNLDDAKLALTRQDIRFPLVVKPRWGTASIGIEYTEDLSELESTFFLTGRRVFRTIISKASTQDAENSVVIQEKLKGDEYHLDVLNDLQGNYVATFAKRKLAMRAGETDKAVTVHDAELEEIGRRLGEGLGHIGNLDCDIFASDKGLSVLEMNPRFGGGYPFAHEAGADAPAAIVAWAQGREANPAWLSCDADVSGSKCDRIVITSRS